MCFTKLSIMGFTKFYLFDQSNGHFLICEPKRMIVKDLFHIDVFLLYYFLYDFMLIFLTVYSFSNFFEIIGNISI